MTNTWRIRDAKGIGLKALSTVALILLPASAVHAQPTSIKGCKGAQHEALNFWVGDWDVHWATPQGRTGTGRNLVTKGLDDCVVFEDFVDQSTGNRGRSMSAFVASAGKWTLVWMDNRPSLLQATGGPTNDGAFEFDLVPAGRMQGRVRMEDIQPNSLTWRLQSKSGRGPWTDVIISKYRRR